MGSEFLYHYTSEENINSIINSKSIWLSDVWKYNKRENFELFFKPYYFEVIQKLKKQRKDSRFISDLPDTYDPIYTKGRIKGLLNLDFEDCEFTKSNITFKVGFEYPADCSFYILCFSRNRNNSYLRTYYANGNPKILIVNKEKFLNACERTITNCIQNALDEEYKGKNYSIKLGNVIRKKTRNKNYITLGKEYIEFGDVIYTKQEKLRRIEDLILSYDTKIIAGRMDIKYKKYINLLMYQFFLLSLFFKEEGFSLENESRLVVPCPINIKVKLRPGSYKYNISIPIEDIGTVSVLEQNDVI